ncbi:MAG: VCBS repeat-containing protein, partial [Polyangiaceae bacterium]
GATAVHVYTPCSGNAVNGLLTQAPPGGHVTLPDVQLDGAKIRGGLHMFDVNSDGHLDLLIDAVDANDGHPVVQVAFGRGDGTFTSDAAVGAAEDDKAKESPLVPAYPLAVGQLTNDRRLDFVTPASIFLSEGGGDAGPAVGFRVNAPRGVAWSEAHILDLNGDGLPDVITGSNSGSIDVYTNGADGLFSHSSYASDGAAANFVFGDFDGDHNADTAFVSGTDTLLVMFGRKNSAPEPPVALAQFDFIEQVVSGELETSVNGSLPDGVTDLGVVWRSADASLQNISILQGSTDRAIQAPFPLSLAPTVSGGIRGPTSGALGLALGQFTLGSDGKVVEPAHQDIAAVAIGPGATPDQGVIHFWRVQMFGEASIGPDPNRSGNLPKLVGDSITVSADPGIETYDRGAANAGTPNAVKHDWTRVQLASVSLHGQDGVSIDDLVVLAPPSPTGVGTLYVERSTNGVFTDVVPAISLGPDRPDRAGRWQLGSMDLNDDHANEVVVLVDGPDAKVQVYWNRRDGSFDGTPHVIELPVEFPACKRHKVECGRPIGFAAVHADADAPKELFILTAEHVFSAKNTPGTDDFKVTEVAFDLGSIEPTSITGGDVDGDGIDDVILTSARAFTVFTGECAGIGCETRVLR